MLVGASIVKICFLIVYMAEYLYCFDPAMFYTSLLNVAKFIKHNKFSSPFWQCGWTMANVELCLLHENSQEHEHPERSINIEVNMVIIIVNVMFASWEELRGVHQLRETLKDEGICADCGPVVHPPSHLWSTVLQTRSRKSTQIYQKMSSTVKGQLERFCVCFHNPCSRS